MTTELTMNNVIARLARIIRNSNLCFSSVIADKLSGGSNVPEVRVFKGTPKNEQHGTLSCKLCGSSRKGKYIVLPKRRESEQESVICADVAACLKRGHENEEAAKREYAETVSKVLAKLNGAIVWPK